MKPFDLELAKSGHQLVTRDGNKAILVYIHKYSQYNSFPVVVYLPDMDRLNKCTLKGEHMFNKESDCDLFMLEPTMNFGQALENIKQGKKVSRDGWNGKGMFLFLVPGSTFEVNRPPLLGIYPEGVEIFYRPHIDMRTVNGEIVPWVASQTDVLAEDWMLVE